MKVKNLAVGVVMCIGYSIVSLYTAYSMLQQRKTGNVEAESQLLRTEYSHRGIDQQNSSVSVVQIWDIGTAAAFLWHDVLQGMHPLSSNNGWFQSSLQLEDITFWYRQSRNIQPKNAPLFMDQCLILGLEAHTESSKGLSKAWLDFALNLHHTCGIGLIVLGNPECQNDWLRPYLQEDKIKFVFLVYDSPFIDSKKVFSWPLGPKRSAEIGSYSELLDVTAPRKYTCNFVGTTLPNTSRQTIFQLNKENILKHCQVKFKNRYASQNLYADSYRQIIKDSDLTLSPSCKNSECSRTYEAMSLGSVPVIEDVIGPRTCNSSKYGSYSIFKQKKAPVIFVKDWRKELPKILTEYEQLTSSQKVRRRINLLKWYDIFKNDLKQHFIGVVQKTFVN